MYRYKYLFVKEALRRAEARLRDSEISSDVSDYKLKLLREDVEVHKRNMNKLRFK